MRINMKYVRIKMAFWYISNRNLQILIFAKFLPLVDDLLFFNFFYVRPKNIENLTFRYFDKHEEQWKTNNERRTIKEQQ